MKIQDCSLILIRFRDQPPKSKFWEHVSYCLIVGSRNSKKKKKEKKMFSVL